MLFIYMISERRATSMKLSNGQSVTGVITEQGDYGIFQPLSKTDQRRVINESTRNPFDPKQNFDRNEQIRLGDCSHLDRK